MTAIQRPRKRTGDQAGIALIEALVSALLLTIVAAGTFTYFAASDRATAQERRRAQANALAEGDLERMRSLPVTCPKTNPSCTYAISVLAGAPQTRTVFQDGTTYTIVSRAEYQNEPAITTECAAGAGSRDYLTVTSTVTWPDMGTRPPVTTSSLVTPPSGSVVPNSGSLRINVVDSRGLGIPGVTLTGGGINGTQGSFSGTTGPAGCGLWKSLPEGNYSLTVGGAAASMVNNDGNRPNQVANPQVGVPDQATGTRELMYDRPGSVDVSFQTQNYTGTLGPTSFDSLVFLQTGMSSQARLFTVSPPAQTITATQLFPFTSSYSAFAGTCSGSSPAVPGDNPNPTSANPAPVPNAIRSFTVPQGGSASPQTIQLPALLLNVYRGTGTDSAKSVGATVKVRDVNCGNSLRTYTTNASGQLDQPGLPFSDFSVCASGLADNGSTRSISTSVSLNDGQTDLDAGTAVNLFLRSGSTSGGGLCP
jgi:Tfp pilus assembly protein PilV